ncbi:MAG TPA: WxL domain-containing protein [Bacilli bacterium]
MNKKLGLSLPFVLIISLFLSLVVLGANVGVSGGELKFDSNTDPLELEEGDEVATSNSGIFPAAESTIDVSTAIPALTAVDYIRLDDDRGTHAGWSVKVSASNLTSAALTDPTSTTSGTVVITIPVASVFAVVTNNLNRLSGSLKGVSVPSGSAAITTGGVNVMNAVSGRGSGAYKANVNYTLTLPNYLPPGSTVVPSAPSTSSLDEFAAEDIGAGVEDLGLFAGSYSTTVTYAISQAP